MEFGALKRLARRFVDAMLQLGWAHEHGLGTSVDMAAAEACRTLLASQDYYHRDIEMRTFLFVLLAVTALPALAQTPCASVNPGAYKDILGPAASTEHLSRCLSRHTLCTVTQEQKIHGYTLTGADPIHHDVLMAFYNDVENNACVVTYWKGGTEPENAVDVWQRENNAMVINRGLSGVLITDGLTAKGAGDFLVHYVRNTRHRMAELNRSCTKHCGFGKNGLYIGFFAGGKMGGSSDHPELAARLKKLTKGSKGVFCVKGPDPLSSTEFAEMSYRVKHPVPEIVKCQDSAAVYVGPYDTAQAAKNAGESMQVKLWHTYFGSMLRCNKNHCVISFPN